MRLFRRSLMALIPLGLVVAGCGAPKKSAPGPGVGTKAPMPGQTGALTAGQPPGGMRDPNQSPAGGTGGLAAPPNPVAPGR